MLNPDCITIAGNPEAWDQEMEELRKAWGNRTGTSRDASLCALQESQYMRGRRSATIYKTIHGFSVRSDTNLDNREFIPGGRALPTWEAAIEVGVSWAAWDPNNRQFWVFRRDMERYGKP